MNSSVLFKNNSSDKIRISIEPWAEVHFLNPQDSMNLKFEYEVDGELEVSHEIDGLTIYLWSTCSCVIYINDKLMSR
jgi:hypothetical protein